MNREQIKRDIAIALDFAMQIIDNPSIFADEAAITFPEDENLKKIYFVWEFETAIS